MIEPDEPTPRLADGCVLCYEGAKMVLFVTGRCGRNCWYCPLSDTRRNKDVVYANDRLVKSPDDLIEEAEMMSALGTGVTGGEPFLVLDNVVRYCRLLKEHFGSGHHIHLYTGIAPKRAQLEPLRGLVDEIRLHPPRDLWAGILKSPYATSVQTARDLGFSIGIEVPSLPGMEALAAILPDLDFLNINELEWSETNAEAMRERNLDLEDGLHNAVGGAAAWAAPLLGDEKVHFCSSTFKDSVQLRERLKRIAENTARPFDEVTDDGTIVYGVLEIEDGRVPQALKEDIYDLEVSDTHVEMAWWVLAELRDRLPGRKEIVERYPNGGIILEVTPL
ncbi:radical SAM protein [uncultured Methanofollis sp.]|uniref:radical SAM protein n=1 Tax=uncultured Methanofollis sp. TaxID=262500 RepID=UPI002622DE7F|nr:radical SAM protein [uncultured Methanofollis sp.]